MSTLPNNEQIQGNISCIPANNVNIYGDGSGIFAGSIYSDKINSYTGSVGCLIEKVLCQNGTLTITNTLDATSSSLGGTITTAGGMAIKKSLYLGGLINTAYISTPVFPVAGTCTFYSDILDSKFKSINSSGITTVYNPTNIKGDLFTNNGTTVASLSVFTNNSVLVADSTQTTGLRWSNLSNIVGSFGSEFNVINSSGTNTSTASTFTTNLTLTFNALGGNYYFALTYQTASQINNNYEVKVVLDATITVHDKQDSNQSPSTTSSRITADFSVQALTAGSHSFVMSYASLGTGGGLLSKDGNPVSMYNSRMLIHRIS